MAYNLKKIIYSHGLVFSANLGNHLMNIGMDLLQGGFAVFAENELCHGFLRFIGKLSLHVESHLD